MNPITIGGVPEHFNLPWQRLGNAERGAGGMPFRWRECPGGTGEMVHALNDGTLDVALLLTEGALTGIAAGGVFRIVSLYTQSPLIWGIHVPADSRLLRVDELRRARYAISRLGSGSHLMCYVLAEQQGWPVGDLGFERVGNLGGAVRAFEQGTANAFLWERFMTLPLVRTGRFRRIGELIAPWPAFVACASLQALERRRVDVDRLLSEGLAAAQQLAAAPDAPAEIAQAFGLDPEDVSEWLAATRWADRVSVDPSCFDAALALLRKVGLVDETFDGELTA
jgi:sulfonate transport system substrate-binding protein